MYKKPTSHMNVKTAVRTLDLFEVFANLQRPLNLSELAQKLKIPVSSCFALVRTLENCGYLYTFGANKDMYPTKRLLNIAQQITAGDPLLERLEPVLQKLRDDTGETVALSKRQGDRIVYLDVYDSPNSIRYNAYVGEFKYLHTSSGGKAFLGVLSEEELDQTLKTLDLIQLTPHTLTDRQALRDDIMSAKERGWYCNISESVSDLMGVGVTISIGAEQNALSVAGPVYRMQPHLDRIAKELLKAKDTIKTLTS